MGELAGRVALVTGAGRGIRRATALALVREGAQVVAVARCARELASLNEECGAVPVPAALDDPAGCALAVSDTRESRAVGGAGLARAIAERHTAAVDLPTPSDISTRFKFGPPCAARECRRCRCEWIDSGDCFQVP